MVSVYYFENTLRFLLSVNIKKNIGLKVIEYGRTLEKEAFLANSVGKMACSLVNANQFLENAETK